MIDQFFFILCFNVCRIKNKISLYDFCNKMQFIPCFLLVETNKYMQYNGNVMKKNYFAILFYLYLKIQCNRSVTMTLLLSHMCLVSISNFYA